VRGGYGLSYTGMELAISSSIFQNPGLITFPNLSYIDPRTCNAPQTLANNCGIVYAFHRVRTLLAAIPRNPNTVLSLVQMGCPTSGAAGVQIFPNTLPTTRVHHYSADVQYDLGHQFVASWGIREAFRATLFLPSEPACRPCNPGFRL